MVFPTSENTAPDISLDALPSTSKEIEVDSPTVVTANSSSNDHDSTASVSSSTGTPSNLSELLKRALDHVLEQERQQKEHPEALVSRSALPNGGTSSDGTDQLMCPTSTTSADSVRHDSNPLIQLAQLLSAQNGNALPATTSTNSVRHDSNPLAQLTQILSAQIGNAPPATMSASYDNRDRPSASVNPASSRMPACQENENAPRPMSRRRISHIWNFFDKRNGSAYCHNCTYIHSAKRLSSTNLKSHMKTHHKRQHAELCEMERTMPVFKKKEARVPGPTSRFKGGYGRMPNSSAQGETPGLLATTHPTIASSLFTARPVNENNRKRHPVWKYFGPADNGLFKCTECGWVMSGYTTNLKSHLKYHHETAHIEVLMAEIELTQNKVELTDKKKAALEKIMNILTNQGREDVHDVHGLSRSQTAKESEVVDSTPTSVMAEGEHALSKDILDIQRQAFVDAMNDCLKGQNNVDFVISPQFQRLVACLNPDFQFTSDKDTLLAWAQSARRQQ